MSQAADYSEEQILHATFVAFQEPGLLTATDIIESQTLLKSAAEAGDSNALLVLERYGSAFAERNPEAVTVVADTTH